MALMATTGKSLLSDTVRWQRVAAYIIRRKSILVILMVFLGVQSIRFASQVTTAHDAINGGTENNVGSSMAEFKSYDRQRVLLHNNSSLIRVSRSGLVQEVINRVGGGGINDGSSQTAIRKVAASNQASQKGTKQEPDGRVVHGGVKDNTSAGRSKVEPRTVLTKRDQTEEADSMEKSNPESVLQYCPWLTSGPRSSKCLGLLKHHVSEKKHWFFLGDSNMYLVYKQIRLENEGFGNSSLGRGWELTKEHTSGRCNHTDYYGLEKASEWVFPEFTRLEGPVGIDHGKPPIPWCSDLHWAFNQKIEKDGTSLEFLVCDFARDVETPSQTTTTTQETISLYLAKNYPHRSQNVCVANAGLHDMAIPGPYVDKPYILYVTNVKEYLRLLKQRCGVVIWVTMIATKGDNRYPQMNGAIRRWNKAVWDMIRIDHPDVFVVDQFLESYDREHVDNAHLTTEYYNQFGNFWRQFSDSSLVLPAVAANQ